MDSFELQVLTYNMHKGFNANRRFVLAEIRDAFEKADVDLIFLQEIQGEHRRRRGRIAAWPDTAQFEFLGHGMWPHWAYGKNAVYRAGHHGNAILSKYPFVSWENINVSAYRRASRSLLHAVVELPRNGEPIHVVCLHLALVSSERRRQLAVLSQFIDTHVPKDAPLIIAGDFNDWRGRAGHLMQVDHGLEDVFKTMTGRHARTFPAWLPVLPVDRIYYRGIRPQACSRLPWRRLSDHAALHASFAV